MQEIGNYRGVEPLRSDEERTHWGLWSIISAPLILGADLTDQSMMDRIWPTITNTDALAINDAWAGKPGTLVRSYPATSGEQWRCHRAGHKHRRCNACRRGCTT